MSDTSTVTDTIVKLQTPTQWKVLLHNDEFTPMDFVVSVLFHIFNKNIDEANRLMMAVHDKGKAVVGHYTKEVASTKLELTEIEASRYEFPLLVTMEQA